MYRPENGVSDSMPAVGSRRSVRDRLGRNVGDSFAYEDRLSNKRLRGDDARVARSANTNGVNDLHIGEDDLRFKIIQRNMFRRTRNDALQDNFDLRENLSRMAQPPMSSNSIQHPWAERKEPHFLEPFVLSRGAGDLPQIAPVRTSSSPWNLEQLRRRSSEENLSSYGGLSPPQRNAEEFQKGTLGKSFDDVESSEYTSKDVDPVRAVDAAPLMGKLPAGSVKPIAPVPSLMPHVRRPGNDLQKSANMVDQQSSIDRLLNSLGLEKYAVLFKAEEVDMATLKQLGDHDLKDLGIPMGPRKKILLAAAHPKRQHR